MYDYVSLEFIDSVDMPPAILANLTSDNSSIRLTSAFGRVVLGFANQLYELSLYQAIATDPAVAPSTISSPPSSLIADRAKPVEPAAHGMGVVAIAALLNSLASYLRQRLLTRCSLIHHHMPSSSSAAAAAQLEPLVVSSIIRVQWLCRISYWLRSAECRSFGSNKP